MRNDKKIISISPSFKFSWFCMCLSVFSYVWLCLFGCGSSLFYCFHCPLDVDSCSNEPIATLSFHMSLDSHFGERNTKQKLYFGFIHLPKNVLGYTCESKKFFVTAIFGPYFGFIHLPKNVLCYTSELKKFMSLDSHFGERNFGSNIHHKCPLLNFRVEKVFVIRLPFWRAKVWFEH